MERRIPSNNSVAIFYINEFAFFNPILTGILRIYGRYSRRATDKIFSKLIQMDCSLDVAKVRGCSFVGATREAGVNNWCSNILLNA